MYDSTMGIPPEKDEVYPQDADNDMYTSSTGRHILVYRLPKVLP